MYESLLSSTGTIVYPLNYIDEVPYPVQNNGCVVYDNRIHILGGLVDSSNETKHYSWGEYNGWKEESVLPCKFANSPNAIVYDGKIHILGNGSIGEGYGDNPYYAHYAWGGANWESVSTLPINFKGNGRCIVYDNKLHIFIYNNHYAWDGVSWEEVSTTPISCSYSIVYIYDNKIYLYGGDTTTNSSWCSWNGTSWSGISHSGTEMYSRPIVYGENVYLINHKTSSSVSEKYMVMKCDTLESVPPTPRLLPYYADLSLVVFYNNEIHIMGGGSDYYRKNHYHLIDMENNRWSNSFNMPTVYIKNRKNPT